MAGPWREYCELSDIIHKAPSVGIALKNYCWVKNIAAGSKKVCSVSGGKVMVASETSERPRQS